MQMRFLSRKNDYGKEQLSADCDDTTFSIRETVSVVTLSSFLRRTWERHFFGSESLTSIIDNSFLRQR